MDTVSQSPPVFPATMEFRIVTGWDMVPASPAPFGAVFPVIVTLLTSALAPLDTIRMPAPPQKVAVFPETVLFTMISADEVSTPDP
jgi:hypothetical protein